MRFILFFLFLFFFSACNPTSEALTIDEKQMVEIVKDLHLAEEMVSRFRKNDQDSVRFLYKEEISKIYNLSIDEIDTNIEILVREPELGHKIYAKAYEDMNKDYQNIDSKK